MEWDKRWKEVQTRLINCKNSEGENYIKCNIKIYLCFSCVVTSFLGYKFQTVSSCKRQHYIDITTIFQ